jgi:hypothetical protein
MTSETGRFVGVFVVSFMLRQGGTAPSNIDYIIVCHLQLC